ncbi:bloodthirsty-related gene family, member 12 [Engraulis encrasicolus]|uniref:bloodthirsty-related gene family, member 12 n=1 Tax=Engraulis encrasicolus TaxID=184585 RepID=UPI002FD13BEA
MTTQLAPPASPARTLSEEQFQCSICLEVFVEPVSTPCGHSFCKACLMGYWDHSKKFLCPMCKKSYTRRPELSVNRVLAEIAAQFQGMSVLEVGGSGGGGGGGGGGVGVGGGGGGGGSVGGSPMKGGSSSSRSRGTGDYAVEGDIACDACIGRKLKALKSCLSCPGSFCETHLRPHRKVKTLQSHRLVAPAIAHLEDKLCRKHERLLEAYCRNCHVCICPDCAEQQHRTHDIVSTEREWKKKMSLVTKRRAEMKHLIKERAKKLDEIKQSIKVIKSSAQKELEDSWQLYAELQKVLERSQAELVEEISTRQRQAEEQARELSHSLEQELNMIKRRSNELETLIQTHDRVLFLQLLPTLPPPPPEPADWSGVTVNTDIYLGTIRKSVNSLVDKFQDELKKLHGKELVKLQNYANEVLLDPATAQRNLTVSEDGRQVRYEEHRSGTHSNNDSPRRFNPALFVMAREGMTSGRHYWEVDVSRKTAWTLGVARASARRKGELRLSPEGGFWCLWLKEGKVKALTTNRMTLELPAPPQKVGVFLDHEAGRVSFYDARLRTHLVTFESVFDGENLHPIFSPCPNQDGKNSAPLALTTVKHG